MLSILLNIFCLMIIIGVHEYGHFISAIVCGLKPVEFSIGFGRKLFSFRHMGTTFCLKLIPAGGYVEIPAEEMDSLSWYKQAFIAFCGPLANLLLCILICVIAAPLGIGNDLLGSHIGASIIKTVGIFFFLLPVTFIALIEILISPIKSFSMIGGPIGILSGAAMPAELINGVPVYGQMLLFTYLISLAVGTMNLMPLSFLDGGRIFGLMISKFPRIQKVWRLSSTLFLLYLIVYAVGGDIIKIFIHK